MMFRRASLVVAFAALFTATGCIPVPTLGVFASHRNPYEGKVGDSKSSAPLHVQTSLRADVERVLGKPAGVSKENEYYPHPETWMYFSDTTRWIWIWLLPKHGGNIEKVRDMHSLYIYFTSDGRIDHADLQTI